MWTPGVRRDDRTLSADPTITVSIRPWSSPVISARLTAVLMHLDEARRVRSFPREQKSIEENGDFRTPGRPLGRQVARGELSTRCLAAQRDAAQCERRFSAARASRAIRRAGRSDPPLRCLRQPQGWPRGGGRSCPRGTLGRAKPLGRRTNIHSASRYHSRLELGHRAKQNRVQECARIVAELRQ